MPRYSQEVRPAGPVRVGPVDQRTGGASAFVAAFFVFLLYSRLHELIPFRARIALLLIGISTMLVILSGRLGLAARSRAGKLLIGFCAWLAMGVPFSVYRRAAADQLVNFWLISFVAFFVCAALLIDMRQLRRAMAALAVGAWTITFLVLVSGKEELGGRVTLDFGSLTNPNSVAFYLVFGLPYSMYMVTRPGAPKLGKAAAVVGSALIVLVTLRTGSRMGLVVSGVVLMLFLLRGSMVRMVTGAAAVAGLGWLLMSVLPEGITLRYRTIVDNSGEVSAEAKSEDAETLARWAEGSTSQRTAAIKAGLKMTLRHPIFGVGEGQFGTETDGNWDVYGRGVASLQPHNLYTQLSSETGIPGFVLYMMALVHCLRTMRRVYKASRERPELAQFASTSYCLFVSLASFAVMGMFAHSAYAVMFPIAAGFTTVLERLWREQAAYAAAVAAPAPALARSAAAPTGAALRLRDAG